MRIIDNQTLTGERALFHGSDLLVTGSTFTDGESPLKESRDVVIERSEFGWKYPLWYSERVSLTDSVLHESARSGIWYTHDIAVTGCTIHAPKTFRRSSRITLRDVQMPCAAETLWDCEGVMLTDVSVTGDYFGMNSARITAKRLRIDGNYAFDGARDVEISDSVLNSKDAFWNAENVVVRNSTIVGEYLAWNATNVTFVDCTIESLQGLCYVKDLTLVNCRLLDTTLAFEYSTVDADVSTDIGSVINPAGGRIRAASIGELILDPLRVDPTATTFELNEPSHAV
ncbi:MAG: DUF3737 family protein [Demequinaceae bacterium]|nr:DUF3737 family protein [Demequinaceae bacterium]